MRETDILVTSETTRFLGLEGGTGELNIGREGEKKCVFKPWNNHNTKSKDMAITTCYYCLQDPEQGIFILEILLITTSHMNCVKF